MEPTNDSPRTDLRTFVLICALLAASVGVARLALSVLRAHTLSTTWGRETIGGPRLQEMLANLDRVTGGVFLGSSVGQAGFSPASFDEEMARLGAPITTYNLAFLGGNGRLYRLLARRLRESGTTLDVSMLELTPFQHTRARTVGSRFAKFNRSRVAALSTTSEIVASALHSPEEASRLLAMKLLGAQMTDIASTIVKDWIYAPEVMDPQDQDNADFELGFGSSIVWDVAGRGERRSVVSAETARAYEDMLTRSYSRDALVEQRDQRIEETDFLELHFDPELVDDFIAAVRELAPVSRHTVVVVMPVNRAWGEPTPAGHQRLADVLARIHAETGAAIIDLTEAPEFGESDFLDTDHLNEPRGRPKLSRLLADKVARLR